jgi:hypothetical protein
MWILITLSVFGLEQTVLSQSLIQKYYQVAPVVTPAGQELVKETIQGPPQPPFNLQRQTLNNIEKVQLTNDEDENVTLLTVPAFDWVFGCSATAGAMIAGYYDRTGYPNIYTGPTNGGLMPLTNASWGTWTDGSGAQRAQCPLSATRNGLDGRVGRGHVDDYWVSYDSTDDDPFVTNGWEEHTHGDCTGDFMKTSQTTNHGNSDGATSFYYYNSNGALTAEDMETFEIQNEDGGYGLKLFFESRGYTVTQLYNQRIHERVEGGFTFEQYQQEIDAGRPVLIHVTGHTMTGIGYDASTQLIYLHDTWDHEVHTMVWGGSYTGMQHKSVTVIHLEEAPSTGNDFNADGIADILFRNTSTGKNLIFFQNANGTRASYAYTSALSTSWNAEGIADFNGDGITDILFRNTSTGKNLIFFQNANGTRASYAYTSALSTGWSVAGVADFNGDGIADILFRNTTSGKNLIFFQNANGTRASYAYTSALSTGWSVTGVADFNGDGIADILFRNTTSGKNLIFFQNANGTRASYAYTSALSTGWSVARVADFNGDGIADILFRNTSSGKNLIFFQNANGTRASYAYTSALSTSWNVVQ